MTENVEIQNLLKRLWKFFLAITAVINSNPCYSFKTTISIPFDIELLNSKQVRYFEENKESPKHSREQINMLKANLKNIKLNHCNKEGKEANRKLCDKLLIKYIRYY